MLQAKKLREKPVRQEDRTICSRFVSYFNHLSLIFLASLHKNDEDLQSSKCRGEKQKCVIWCILETFRKSRCNWCAEFGDPARRPLPPRCVPLSCPGRGNPRWCWAALAAEPPACRCCTRPRRCGWNLRIRTVRGHTMINNHVKNNSVTPLCSPRRADLLMIFRSSQISSLLAGLWGRVRRQRSEVRGQFQL